MKNWLLAAVCCLGIFGSSPSWAFTGNDLAKWTASYERMARDLKNVDEIDRLETYVLTGYAVGVFDALDLASQICPPVGISHRQLVALIDKEVKAKPGQWTDGASIFVAGAYIKAFPCRRK